MTLPRIAAANFPRQLFLSFPPSLIYVLAFSNLTMFAEYHMTWIHMLKNIWNVGYHKCTLFQLPPVIFRLACSSHRLHIDWFDVTTTTTPCWARTKLTEHALSYCYAVYGRLDDAAPEDSVDLCSNFYVGLPI